jgi:hypothetical protein
VRIGARGWDFKDSPGPGRRARHCAPGRQKQAGTAKGALAAAGVETDLAAGIDGLVAQQVVFKTRFQAVGIGQLEPGIVAIAVQAKGLQRLRESPDAGTVVVLPQQLIELIRRFQL